MSIKELYRQVLKLINPYCTNDPQEMRFREAYLREAIEYYHNNQYDDLAALKTVLGEHR